MARILVVDDDEDIREAVCELLTGEGHDITCAEHGADALARMRAAPRFDLILLDLNMPVLDGRGFVAAVRADPGIPKANVILMSVVPTVREEGAALGVCESLRKPFTREQLLDLLRHCGEDNS